MANPDSTILVIDDNEDMLAMMAIILRGKGYNVFARDKFEQLEKELNEISPSLILLDRKLGWTDGIILCQQIRRFPQFSNIIILIFSAYSIAPEDCAAAGANAYFEKPFGMQEFLEKVEAFI